MVRKTRSQIYLKRLFEDVVWDKQFSFIVCSITPFTIPSGKCITVTLIVGCWYLVFGIWFSWILNASHFILFLFRLTTWYSCKCVLCYVHAFTSFVFHFFFSVFAHVLLLIYPSFCVWTIFLVFFSSSFFVFVFHVYYLFLL